MLQEHWVNFRKSKNYFSNDNSPRNKLSPVVMEQMDPFCVEGIILGPQEVVHSITSSGLVFNKLEST